MRLRSLAVLAGLLLLGESEPFFLHHTVISAGCLAGKYGSSSRFFYLLMARKPQHLSHSARFVRGLSEATLQRRSALRWSGIIHAVAKREFGGKEEETERNKEKGGESFGGEYAGEIGGELEMAGKAREQRARNKLPHLMGVQTLDAMFELLEQARQDSLSPKEAATAMNHLNRLAHEAQRKSDKREIASHMTELSSLACTGANSFSSKQIAWCLNAARGLSGVEEADELCCVCLERLRDLPSVGFGIQNLALILNAISTFAFTSPRVKSMLGCGTRIRNDSKDQGQDFESFLLSLVLSQPADLFSSWQSVSTILNAAVNLGWSQRSLSSLLSHMTLPVTEILSVEGASSQSIALIMNACANAQFYNQGIMQKLSMALSSSQGNGLNAQGVAMLVNSIYRLGHECDGKQIVSLCCAAALRLPTSSFGPQSLGLLLNGCSGLGIKDDLLIGRLAQATLQISIDDPRLNGQHLANIVNAYARMGIGNEKLYGHMASLITASLHSNEIQFKDMEMSSICNAFSRITSASFESSSKGIGGEGARLLTMTEELMLLMGSKAASLKQFGLGPAASIMNAFSKLGLKHPVLLKRISDSVCEAEIESITLTDAAQLYYSLASLNFRDERLQHQLAQVIARASPFDFSPQLLGNVAWAAAVWDEQDQGVHEILSRALDAKFDELILGKEVKFVDRRSHSSIQDEGSRQTIDSPSEVQRPTTYQDLQELRQVHQYFLSQKLKGEINQGFRADICRKVFESRSRNRAASSNFQDTVVAAFLELGCKVKAEFIDEKTGYSIDIIVTIPADWRCDGATTDVICAVEVDGPAHYAGPDQREPLGRTVMKRRHLELTGWPLLSVPFYEWNAVRGREARQTYIVNKVSAALGEEILKDCLLL